ncbi:MAG: lactonase family protein [Ruminococcaceae bacterium]|nr:lactonase family protein [Oscillospiraceae bacterium]
MRNLYIASCTEDGGVFRYSFDHEGNMKFQDKVSLSMPMYMKIYDEKMYALLRAPFDDDRSGLVTFDIENTGALINPSEIVSTMGEVACHLSVSQKGIYVANYISSTVTKMPSLKVFHSGKGVNKVRQSVAHPHFVSLTPDNKYLCVCDLGLDAVITYDWDLNEISRTFVPKGHGARHLVFSDDGKYAFTANEIMSTVTAFKYYDGEFECIDTISGIKEEDLSSTSAAIRYNNGYIYVSNRGNDTISKISFDVNRLELMEEYFVYGKSPRDFIIHNDYIICTNELSNTVSVLCEKDNKVTLVNKINIDRPLCVTFL